MNKIELMQLTKKLLEKFFTGASSIKVDYNRNDGNKINFIVNLDKVKYTGFIYHNNKLTVKDVRNILFSFKRRVIQSLKKEEVQNVDSTAKEIRSGANKQEQLN